MPYALRLVAANYKNAKYKPKGGFAMTAAMQAGGLATLALVATLAAAQPGLAQNLKYKPISVKTPDGLTVSAQEWGNPNGPEILLIHGFAQSHLSWMRQVDSDLAKEFLIITYDLRGHGNSDKPLDKAPYHDNKAWGDEVKAVMDAAGLKRRCWSAGLMPAASSPIM